MERTIVYGGKDSAPRAKKHDPQDEAIAVMWGAIADLWMLGPPYRKMADARARLKAQLEDRSLHDHPSRPAAVTRYVQWAIDLKTMDRRVEAARIAFCEQFDALSVRNRQMLLAKGGWPQIADMEVMADELWDMAMAEDPCPIGEPGF